MQKTGLISTILLLIILNFSLQSYNIFTFSNNGCGFYVFNPHCMDALSFITNKSLRFIINMLCLILLLKHFSKPTNLQLLQFIFILTFLLIIDLFIAFSTGELFIQIHKVLNPIVYSPLLPVTFFAFGMIKKNSA